MELEQALTWANERKTAVLITLRKDGRAQSSDITYLVDDGRFIISLTDSRAKTKNMRRDDRVVLHITEPDAWSYISFDGTVELSAVTAATDDAIADQLVDYFERVTGRPHDDWDEYRQAMVDEGRLIATFTPTKAVGQIH